MSFKNKLLASTLLLSGCAVPMVPGIMPHKIDIQQGNIVTQEMLDKLEPGMTRNQVRYVLGTPLVIDPFRTDRWDYVYTMNRRGVALERRQLKVYFDDDRMVRYEGDVLPETKPGEIATAGRPVAKTVEKVAAKPAVKPPAVAQVEKPVLKPAPVAPAVPVVPAVAAAVATPSVAAAETTALPRLPEPGTPAVSDAENKPNLRLAPSEGEAASAAEKIAAKPVPAKPAVPDSIEAPPLPRIAITPEEPAPATSALATAVAPAVPVAPVAPAAPAARVPAPAVAVQPAPVEKPVPAIIVVAKPAPKPVEKPSAKPATKPATGWFANAFGGGSAPALRRSYTLSGDRSDNPGSAPAPFYNTPEEQAAAQGGAVVITPSASSIAVVPVAPPAPVPAVVAKPAPVVVAKPVPTPAPAPVVEVRAPAVVEKPAAKLAEKPAEKPAAKPAPAASSGGWFNNLFGGSSSGAGSAPSRPRTYGAPRETAPGAAPAPFYDNPEEQAAATGAPR